MRGVIFYFLEISIILYNKYRVFRNRPHFQDKFSHKKTDIRVHTICSIAIFCAYRDVEDAVPYTFSFALQDRRPRRNITLARWARAG